MANTNDGAPPPAAPPQAGPGQAPGPDQQPQVRVLGQYIKDLSFENPAAPDSLRARERPPVITVNVNVGSKQKGEDTEVELRLDVTAKDGEEQLFKMDLLYAGLFKLANIQPQLMPIYLMIECPRLLFPFARQIITDATRNGGFPPVMLDPIDFVRLYQQNLMRLQQAQGFQPRPPQQPN